MSGASVRRERFLPYAYDRDALALEINLKDFDGDLKANLDDL